MTRVNTACSSTQHLPAGSGAGLGRLLSAGKVEVGAGHGGAVPGEGAGGSLADPRSGARSPEKHFATSASCPDKVVGHDGNGGRRLSKHCTFVTHEYATIRQWRWANAALIIESMSRSTPERAST